jgi:hypothetical protein
MGYVIALISGRFWKPGIEDAIPSYITLLISKHYIIYIFIQFFASKI